MGLLRGAESVEVSEGNLLGLGGGELAEREVDETAKEDGAAEGDEGKKA